MSVLPRVIPLPRRAPAPSPPILTPGRNVWQLARADRAAVLIDAAAYFAALRAALRAARHSIIIVGWDIDSRTRLVGSEPPDDGLPETLAAFLQALVEARPALQVKLLLWDYSLLYTLERELLPTVSLQWSTPRQIELCLDDVLPFGASHHQKIVVIDDAVAFAGGLDLTIRRWDTSAHCPEAHDRTDPGGEPYGPFHDVQMIVDGAAARGLGRLVRGRWRRATGERLPAVAATRDPWPDVVPPAFGNVCVGISRTRAAYDGEPAVREIETLLNDLIAAAERTLYIESQFLTCSTICRSLIKALRTKPGLEVAIVAPQTHHTWLEHQTMQAGRARVMANLHEAGVADRARLLYPHVGGVPVMVHSKVMIVDDRLMRIGSSNLCNRSMGTDSECDLTVEATRIEDRIAIRQVRAQLLAEHLGCQPRDVDAVLERSGSLFAVLDGLARPERGLAPIIDSVALDRELAAPIEAVADPPEPLIMDDGAAYTPRRRQHWAAVAAIASAVLLAVLAWRYTNLAVWTNPDKLEGLLAGFVGTPWAPVVVTAGFVASGLVAFPVTVAIAATAAAFGTWPGLLYAALGTLASAAATYAIGRGIGTNSLRRLLGPRLSAIQRRIGQQGVLTVAMVRIVPVAPFTIVNMVAGAMRIRLFDYMLGTFLGLAPGLLVLSALGGRLLDIVRHPTLRGGSLFVGGLLAWIALMIALQRVLTRRRRDDDA